jgi:rRNA maturation endonuclease Nob1
MHKLRAAREENYRCVTCGENEPEYDRKSCPDCLALKRLKRAASKKKPGTDQLTPGLTGLRPTRT